MQVGPALNFWFFIGLGAKWLGAVLGWWIVATLTKDYTLVALYSGIGALVGWTLGTYQDYIDKVRAWEKELDEQNTPPSNS